MGDDSTPAGGTSKQERQAARRQAALARRRRRRLTYGAVAGVLLMVPVLWLIDRSGPHAVVQAEVVRTRLWRHRPADGQPHTHSDATLLIQGLSEVYVQRADNLEKGQWVRVLVRPGRLTGWPYFVELAEEDAPVAAPEGVPAAPLEIDEFTPPEAEEEFEPGLELELEPPLEGEPGPAEEAGEGPG